MVPRVRHLKTVGIILGYLSVFSIFVNSDDDDDG